MAGPGKGPPRKSHTKSRNGCKTCKKRHIRCDEKFPQWLADAKRESSRNCTKHNCRCDYMDLAVSHDESLGTQRLPDLFISPEAKMEIDNWHTIGVPPFPELLHCPRSGWYGLSETELRLVHHIIGLSLDIHRRGLSKCTPWTQKLPNLLAIAFSYDFVMSSILAFSASRLSWITSDQEIKNLACHHRGAAIKGLQEAICSFSGENCEAILAASILLSWAATEWRLWASLQQGLSTILNMMHPVWKKHSELARFLESQQILRSINSPSSMGYHHPRKEDLIPLDQTITFLEDAQNRVMHTNQEHFNRLGELLEFLQHFRKDLPMQSPEQCFERVQPLIWWLFWLLPAVLRGGSTDVSELAIVAQFFGVGIALDPLIRDMGGTYLGALSVGPVEEIFKIIMVRNAADPYNAEFRFAMDLLDLPRQIVAQYKCRLHRSPRPSIDLSSSSSPYCSIQDSSLASPSPPSASAPRAAYASPVQSSPTVSTTTSPFGDSTAGSYATGLAASHAYYPRSSQTRSGVREGQAGLIGFSQPGAFPSTPASSHSYVGDTMLYAGTAGRANGPLGLNMDFHGESHPFNAVGLVTPGLCWT